MRVLVLGGSVFLSRAVAQEHRAKGHDVTCLVRRPDGRLPTGVRAVAGDRAHGAIAYDEVRGSWDAVVDVATDPTFVREALDALGARVRHWTYVSSCSVYRDQDTAHLDESSTVVDPVGEGASPGLEDYAASKSASESRCADVLGDRLAVVRPGLIVGAGDPSDRGGYWAMRFLRDDRPVLVPVAASCAAQWIDVRDVAQWIVQCAQEGVTGAFNAVGDPRSFHEMIEWTRTAVGHRGPLVEADDEWLVSHGVSPWAGPESLPMWIPSGAGMDGFLRRSNARARRSGLRLRPFTETVAEIVSYETHRGLSRERAAGLSPPRERQLLRQLRAGG